MSPSHTLTHQTVAVIGAGPAGLVAVKELRQEGHDVVVFERGAELGGTWVFTPEVESDPLGRDPDRTIVHSSIYSTLRVNIPREALGYRDFPFIAKEEEGRDPRRFPAHQEVLRYLNDFACEYDLNQFIRYNTTVQQVFQLEDGKWNVRSETKDVITKNNQQLNDEIFDAVVVCNGHYTEPRPADDIPGIEQWPGRQVHSHNYRGPKPYTDLVVVIIGSAVSAIDISKDIGTVAKEVHITGRSAIKDIWGWLSEYNNMWIHPKIVSANEDGSIIFEDNVVAKADVILHCTGYKFHYPFLQTNGAVTVDDNRVGPLYKHVFPPSLAPSLSFVGIPWKVLLFPMFELQSRWIARVLSGRVPLPSVKTMIKDTESFYKQLECDKIPKRYTHFLDDKSSEYNDWIASEIGCPLVEEWRNQMFSLVLKNLQIRPTTFQDKWEDDHLIIEAHKDFAKYMKLDSLSGNNEA